MVLAQKRVSDTLEVSPRLGWPSSHTPVMIITVVVVVRYDSWLMSLDFWLASTATTFALVKNNTIVMGMHGYIYTFTQSRLNTASVPTSRHHTLIHSHH